MGVQTANAGKSKTACAFYHKAFLGQRGLGAANSGFSGEQKTVDGLRQAQPSATRHLPTANWTADDERVAFGDKTAKNRLWSMVHLSPPNFPTNHGR